MASKVEVLCPNGHRVTVRITPNTKILQILEEACTKQGFHPAEDYELKRNNRCLDVTQSVRFSGLPNLAKLELGRAPQSRLETDVTVVLQLEAGDRMQRPFSPTTTLWALLCHWDRQHNGMLLSTDVADAHPICIFMREEIIGEYALKETTLRSLGLTAGSAVIRFIHRVVDQAKLMTSRNRIDREKSRLARLAERSLERSLEEGATGSGHNLMEVDTEESVDPADPADPADLVPRPEEAMENDTDLPPCTLEMTDTTEATPSEQTEQRLKSRHRHQVMVTTVDDFKFPEETKGANLYENELSTVKRKESQTCDRKEVIYSLDESGFTSSSASCEELPDEFFEVNLDDVQKMWGGLQATVRHEQPLMTSAMRLALIEEKMEKYEHAVIRIVFPDRIVLQGLFKPTETVYALEKFIKQHLEDKDEPFYLFTSPPKRLLNDNTASFIEAELVPMTIVYFGSSSLKKDRYLASSAMKNVSSQQSATKLLMSSFSSQSSVCSNRDFAGPSQSKQKAPKQQRPNSATDPSVPKWFKIGKK